MKKGLVFLFAALLVVGLPLSSALAAGTTVYHHKDKPFQPGSIFNFYGAGDPFNVWEFTEPPQYFCFYKNDPVNPGPAATFNDNVCVKYLGESSQTVRYKSATGDVGWNRVIQGTAIIVPWDGGGPEVSSVSVAARVLGIPMKSPVLIGPEQSYNFKVEEVGQDDGGVADCLTKSGHTLYDPSMNPRASIDTCANPVALGYLMYHWKINGNSVYFYKVNIKDGSWCQQDTRGIPMGDCTAE
jgi:hypothetical protein